MANAAASDHQSQWWCRSVGYEVYVRSFADSSGDGVGDLDGITARLDHVAELGVDIVWLTPFYPSPMADYGYDVADYCDVDPLFGDLDAFDRLVAAAHDRELRVVIDIVPNHSSIEHPWFRAARSSPSSPHRAYYHWADPAPDGGPPNNWVGKFGGPAWSFDEQAGQFYLHLFLPEQPDLNWRHPAVLDEFDAILRFWLERGVDGFRIDVAHALVKDEEMRSNPQIGPWDPTADRWTQWDAFRHDHDVLQPEAADIYRRWRAIADEYDAVLIGETYVRHAAELAALLPGDGLHVGFWFKPMHIDWDAAAIRDALRSPLAAVGSSAQIGWVSSSHDAERPATRFGGDELGRRRALALATLMLSLPGLAFLYQGDELGLLDGLVPPDKAADPVGVLSMSRDGCRTPMPWEPGVAFGFSSTDDTWLPHGGRSDDDTAAVQARDPGSWLARYQRLVELARRHPDLHDQPIEWLDGPDPIVAFGRGRLAIAANIGDREEPLAVTGEVCFSTSGRTDSVTTPILAPAEALIVDRDE